VRHWLPELVLMPLLERWLVPARHTSTRQRHLQVHVHYQAQTAAQLRCLLQHGAV
jgi:hypothetical protein